MVVTCNERWAYGVWKNIWSRFDERNRTDIVFKLVVLSNTRSYRSELSLCGPDLHGRIAWTNSDDRPL